MIAKNKFLSLISSILIGIMSSVSFSQFNVHAEKIPLSKITKITIFNPDNSYSLTLNQQECQKAAQLIREHQTDDLNTLSEFNGQNILTMTTIQNEEILTPSINCLRLILTHIGGLNFIPATKIIHDSFLRTSYAKFNYFVYQLLSTLEIL